MKIAIITDSSSGFTRDEIKKYDNLYIYDIPYYLDDKEYDDSLENTMFYSMLNNSKSIQTSQPHPKDVMDLWNCVLKEYDYIISLNISSGLSGTCQTLANLALEDEYNGKVFVVDSKRVSLTLKIEILEALKLIEKGYDINYILNYLNDNAKYSKIFISIPNLKFLKKGGRLTKEVALLASLFQIKPVLQINGGVLESYKKTHSKKQSIDVLVKAVSEEIKKDYKYIYNNKELVLGIAYANNYKDALILKEKLSIAYPNLKIFLVDSLCKTIACHTGDEGLGVCVCKVLKDLI